MVRDIFIKVRKFLTRYSNIVICFVVCLVFVIIGVNLSSGSKNDVSAAHRELDDIKNQINQCNVSLQQTQSQGVVAEDSDNIMLDGEKMKSDVKRIATLVQEPFTFNSGTEYVNKRSSFMKKIGANDLFFKQIMTEYTPEIADVYNEGQIIDTGEGFRCNIVSGSFVPYLTKIDKDTGTYSYMATFDCFVLLPAGYSGDLELHDDNSDSYSGESGISFVMTCDVSKEGTISNFHITPLSVGRMFKEMCIAQFVEDGILPESMLPK